MRRTPRTTLEPKVATKPVVYSKGILDLHTDVNLLIISYLQGVTLRSYRSASKSTKALVARYMLKFKPIKGSSTILLPQQVTMVEWAMDRFQTMNSIGLNAYMSAGKTLASLEIGRRVIASGKGLRISLILLAPTILESWKLELKKHYSSEINVNIFIDHSSAAKGRTLLNKMVDDPDILTKDLAITIISTPSAMNNFWKDIATILIFDEAHRMLKPYAKIYDMEPRKGFAIPKKLFLTASDMTIELEDILTISKENASFPELHTSVIVDDDVYTIVNSELKSRKDKHACLILPTSDDYADATDIVDCRKIYNYTSRQVTFLKKFELEGGLLITSIKAISEGNNMNYPSIVYIVNPNHSTFQTINQCLGRFYRESSICVSIEIVFIVPTINSITWVRCRMVDGIRKRLESKSDTRVTRINKYLREKKIEPEELSSDEIVLVYGTSEEDFDTESLVLEHPNIPNDVLLRVMMM